MPLYTIPNGTTGIDTTLIEIMGEVPSFIPALFFFIYMVVFLGGSSAQRSRTGSADTPMWATISGLSVLMVALPLTLTVGLVDARTLSVLVVITVASALWFFLSRSRGEAF